MTSKTFVLTILCLPRECQVFDYKNGQPPHCSLRGQALRASGPSYASPSDITKTKTNPSIASSRLATCGCEAGWFSPRMRYVMRHTSEVASDIVIDSGGDAFPPPPDHFENTDVYLGEHVPLSQALAL